ncbi:MULTISPECIES: hypothetical protein [Mesoflavibacter]|uniref:Lipocalin-like domain-containing protein n=1 Tax=Mesoflavibacter profundi TaxID=2708110 RepID=A0ABT4S439_9FLAO|nr:MULTISPECIES: hypothetical protein [Mesoflavibacter]MDA0178581.1 hypothetical protein [Mesoflavibacter profundi]QIJ89520.1 hypothetical protein C7H62_1711 [Mesoflavibacter sp. HG96]QIJ92248.1 hypothetical protein C7H56_1711 [Mesoflavibacter sp. HG37]
MKKTNLSFNLKSVWLCAFFMLAMLFSCQQEETEIINPSNDDVIEGDSATANLMARTASNDGSIDNIVDYANCLEVNLPVTVTANGVTITIQSVTDYSQLEAILDALTTDDDQVEISFPITVTLNDYSQITITSQQQLDALIADCNGENETDDDIECIDFVYPISFSIYNTDFQVIDTVTVNSDQELYSFLDTLNGPVIASLNFPVSLEAANGDIVVVNSNAELTTAIENADGTCDEDDDYDWNDDDCTEEFIELALKECVWEISQYNNTNTFNDYYIDFDSSYNFTAYDASGNAVHDGSWSVAQSSANFVLTFTTDWSDISGDWIIVDCEHDYEFDLIHTSNNINMQIEQECNTSNNDFDCFESFDAQIVKCDDNLDGFEVFDLTVAFNNCVDPATYNLTYYETIVDAENGTNAIANPQAFTNTTSPQTIYVRVELLTNGNYEIFEIELILEDCSVNCSTQDVEAYLQECKWNVTSLNGDDNLVHYDLIFQSGNALTIINTQDNNSYTGNWEVTEVAGDAVLEFYNVAGPNIQAINDYWKVTNCDTNYLEFINGTSQTMVLEQQNCYTETQLFDAITSCDWTVYSFISNGTDQTDNYASHTYTFHENEFVYATDGAAVNYGSLSADATGSQELIVLFAMYGSSSGLGNYYSVDLISDDYIIFSDSNSNTTLKFEKVCTNTSDNDVEEIQNWLYNGDWQITYSTMDNVDNTSDYAGIEFDFSTEANIIANDNGTITNLQGDVVRDSNGTLRFVINYLGQFPYWQLDDDWYITEVDANRMELHHVNDDNNNQYVLVFEKQ